jgi:hypothetical protein
MALVGPTLVLYAVVGIGIAMAVYLSEKQDASAGILFRVAAAVPFWPLYVPILLSHARAPASSCAHSGDRHRHGHGQGEIDDMSLAISQVDAELEAALNSLDGWAENVLAREEDRIRELQVAWIAQANRIREMDHLLSHLPLAGMSPLPVPLPMPLPGSGTDRDTGMGKDPLQPIQNRLSRSELVCRQNIERLRHIRQQAYDDLMGSLAWVRELISMIHLAKFTGAPASRAEELVAQIAAAVEGLADVTWREDSFASADDNISTLGQRSNQPTRSQKGTIPQTERGPSRPP